jgi:hypothetical protein
MPWIQRNNLFLYFVSKLKLEFFLFLFICQYAEEETAAIL